MDLSEHFTLEEATVSQTAARQGIDNSHPPQEVIDAAIKTATRIEKVRALLGAPIHVTSWIRTPALNIALGSKTTSQHLKGEAVDFICPTYGDPAAICKLLVANADLIRYDQLILEHTWVHISWNSIPNAIQRGQVLSLIKDGAYAAGLTDKFGTPLTS